MPDFPVLSGAEIVEALERLDFAQDRQRGSHVVLKRGAAGCVMPLHREVKRRTRGNIVGQASLDPADFLAALRHRCA